MHRRVLTSVLLAGVLSLGPASGAGAAHTGSTGAFTVDATIAHPTFPCAPIPVACIAPVEGTVAGHAAGVQGTTPWQVSIDGATFSGTVPYFTGSVLTATDRCFVEEARDFVTATDASVTGTYGMTPVESASIHTELELLRFGETALFALAFFELKLGLAGGGEVVVTDSSQQSSVGTAVWEIVEGTPDCGSYDNPVPVTARIRALTALT